MWLREMIWQRGVSDPLQGGRCRNRWRQSKVLLQMCYLLLPVGLTCLDVTPLFFFFYCLTSLKSRGQAALGTLWAKLGPAPHHCSSEEPPSPTGLSPITWIWLVSFGFLWLLVSSLEAPHGAVGQAAGGPQWWWLC